ncbi:polymeric immunoglobulin receptor-like isoform X2 [Hyperolius riggenbachi]|uniref:polymeric immunoglobulin receptor-like isoform X2 n=1 Tax=Hyperolius riggenbachi TaxID=752182 RepID=UPI0035A365E9
MKRWTSPKHFCQISTTYSRSSFISAIAIEGEDAVLPCFSLYHHVNLFWERGSCSFNLRPTSTILSLNNNYFKLSDRYKPIGPWKNGHADLLIPNVTMEDAGKYCCIMNKQIGNALLCCSHHFITVTLEVRPAVKVTHYVTGMVGESMVLPCAFGPISELKNLCWGRGNCSAISCNSPVVKAEAEKVSWKKSDRYELKVDVEQGNASLQITDVTLDDDGIYCCEMMALEGPQMSQVQVAIQTPVKVTHYVTGMVGESVVLHCGSGPIRELKNLCWGRGNCSANSCNSPVVKAEAEKVSWKKSDRYELKVDVEQGNASLQITDVTLDDDGIYCCGIMARARPQMSQVQVEIQTPPLQNNLVRGAVDSVLILPCKYSTDNGKNSMCWGRGYCGFSGCPNEILKTDGDKVTWSHSGRYQLRGNPSTGDVSLTINGVFKDDEGTYCCRVRVPGPFNDLKTDITLEVEDVNLVKGSLNEKLTLPCSYSTDHGKFPMCWGRGHCPVLSCHNTILSTDGEDVSWRQSDKYQLKEDIETGHVSLTINNANEDDGGVYCCRVEVPGVFNDIKKEIRVQIEHTDHVTVSAGEAVKLPCSYNTSEGTNSMCWGRGKCPTFKCKDAIVQTDGMAVAWAESNRYEMKERLEDGDVSLTIRGVTKEDGGYYCCRVDVPGPFNDKMKEINVEVHGA